jgi:hypothetical protein
LANLLNEALQKGIEDFEWEDIHDQPNCVCYITQEPIQKNNVILVRLELKGEEPKKLILGMEWANLLQNWTRLLSLDKLVANKLDHWITGHGMGQKLTPEQMAKAYIDEHFDLFFNITRESFECFSKWTKKDKKACSAFATYTDRHWFIGDHKQ